MQKACDHTVKRCYHTLSAQGFRFYFTPLTGVLFTFPSRYLFTIGHRRVFSLRRWASRIQTEFHVFRSTWELTRRFQDFVYGSFTLFGETFQNLTLSINAFHLVVPQPQHRSVGLGCSPFVRHYLGNHGCFLFHQVLRCFTSLSIAPYTLCIQVQVILDLAGLGFPIRRSPDYSVFATTRSLSQLITSFIAIRCQGIHLVLFVT